MKVLGRTLRPRPFARQLRLALAGLRGTLDPERRLRESGFSTHDHVFMPEDVVAALEWLDAHGVGVRIVEGPVSATNSLEFHLLVEKEPPGRAEAGDAGR